MRGAGKLWGRHRESGETVRANLGGVRVQEKDGKVGISIWEKLRKHILESFVFPPFGVPGKEKEEKKGHLLSVYSVRRRL